MHQQSLIVRWSMPITVGLLFILSFLPANWLKWTDWFSAQVQVAIVPITHPLTIVVDTIVPARISNPAASERERALLNELDRSKLELLQVREENARLERLLKEYSSGASLSPDLEIRQETRPRVGNLAGDILLIRTGNVDGLVQGTVVVTNATQLIGRVSRVNERTAHVLPITAPGAQPIIGTILLNEEGSKQARCFLRPTGNGTLRGEVARPALDQELNIEIGQKVRLLDTQWPTSAQMLIIGTIERVEPDPEQPLRPQIVVRPTSDDLRRLPEVTLRIPYTGSDSGGRP
ncbi:MAG: rod shape-determining protein MreC [Phycisphaerales bacterium]